MSSFLEEVCILVLGSVKCGLTLKGQVIKRTEKDLFVLFEFHHFVADTELHAHTHKQKITFSKR